MSVGGGRSHSYRRGLWGEWLAAAYFMVKGYRIMARRYKTKGGEIDLIVGKGWLGKPAAVVFVEVKTRSVSAADDTEALEAVTPRSQARIRSAAERFLQQSPDLLGVECSFDVVLVRPPVSLKHIRVAF